MSSTRPATHEGTGDRYFKGLPRSSRPVSRPALSDKVHSVNFRLVTFRASLPASSCLTMPTWPAGNNCFYSNLAAGTSVQMNSRRSNNPTPVVNAEQNYWNGQQANNRTHCTLEPDTHAGCTGDSGTNGGGNVYCCPSTGCTNAPAGCNLTTHTCVLYPSVACNGGSDCISKCSRVSVGTVLTNPPAACQGDVPPGVELRI